MELRWILILAGMAILVLLYLSGRPRRSAMPAVSSAGGSAAGTMGSMPQQQLSDAMPYSTSQPDGYSTTASSMQDLSYHGGQHGGLQGGDPLLDEQKMGYADTHAASRSVPQDNHYGAPAQQLRPDYAPDMSSAGHSGMGFEIDPHDMARPADSGFSYPADDGLAAATSQHDAELLSGQQSGKKSSSLAATFGAIGQRLTGKRSTGANDQHLAQNQASAGVDPKIVTLHVVAPQGQVIHGPRLLGLFEQRNYHFGEMNIFHSLHEEKIVFSVAKMVEPGEFDLNSPASFETPGITMILQLPGPVSADVALEVLIREATEMAEALGCSILDSGHSTLSGQTVQHLRDSVHQFMHRQRLADAVPS